MPYSVLPTHPHIHHVNLSTCSSMHFSGAAYTGPMLELASRLPDHHSRTRCPHALFKQRGRSTKVQSTTRITSPAVLTRFVNDMVRPVPLTLELIQLQHITAPASAATHPQEADASVACSSMNAGRIHHQVLLAVLAAVTAAVQSTAHQASTNFGTVQHSASTGRVSGDDEQQVRSLKSHYFTLDFLSWSFQADAVTYTRVHNAASLPAWYHIGCNIPHKTLIIFWSIVTQCSTTNSQSLLFAHNVDTPHTGSCDS